MPSRRYTEEQFRTALDDPEVRTMADLCRALGIVPRGANYETLRAFAVRLDLDTDRILTLRWLGTSEEALALAVGAASSMGALLRQLGVPDRSTNRRRLRALLGDTAPDASPLPMRPDGRRAHRSYTDTQLLDALSVARNYGELCEHLGLMQRSGTIRRLRERAATLGAPIPTHWSRPGSVGPDGVRRRPAQAGQRRYGHSGFDQHDLETAVASASSIAEAIRALGHEPSGTTRRWFERDVRRHGIDVSHFPPRSARGGRKRRPIDEVLVRGRQASSRDLRRRLIDEGIKEARCEMCLQARWNGAPIPLELDHIDGDRMNNLLENLRLLCPNCHAFTPTYRGRNIGRSCRSRPPTIEHDGSEEP
jgi:hypothetical protein